MNRCRGKLRFVPSATRTVLAEAFAQSPLRVLTPRNHGTGAWAYLSSLGGGLVDGDAVELELAVDPGALAFVSTQGPGRVYRSARGTTQALHAHVGEGALLAYVPEPLACFEKARYAQSVTLDVAKDGSLVYVDVLTAGRVARGERWAASALRAELRLRVGDDALLEEALLLDPAHGQVAQRMGPFDAYATVLLVGPRTAGLRERFVRSVTALPLRRGEPLLESASALRPDVLVFRAAAHAVEQMTRRLHHHLAPLAELLGDDPFSRRPDAFFREKPDAPHAA